MYWLIGFLIIVIMLGVLNVAEDVITPASPLLEGLTHLSIPPLLIVIALCLWLLLQRHILSSSPSPALVSQAAGSPSDSKIRFLPHISVAFRYLLATMFAGVLIIGSALQALSSYQQAQASSITESMRVQAWVSIEGVSDSVYDPTTNSGYRQVAILRSLSPLVSEVTTKDLDIRAPDYIKNNSISKTEALKASHSKDISTSSDNRDNVNNINNQDTKLEYRVLLNAYPKAANNDNNLANLNDLAPNTQVLMTLALLPLKSAQDTVNNPTGFDSYRWLRGRHIDGIANIIAVGTPIDTASISKSSTRVTSSPVSLKMVANNDPLLTFQTASYITQLRIAIDQWRWQLRQHFYQDWQTYTIAEQQVKAVTLSLLTGDRSLINRDTKDLYQLAGISHLLAISGTHVLFLAIMLAGAAVFLIDRTYATLYSIVPRWQVRWWVMIGAAFVYALFTGFDVPAARTAWMLLAIGLVRLTLLPISTMRVLLALAVLLAWFDPYVLWQAGYWLSFAAVALLLKYEEAPKASVPIASPSPVSIPIPITGANDLTFEHTSDTLLTKISMIGAWLWSIAKGIFRLQLWMFIALLPITLLLFGKVSLWGLVINLFAIGLFGWVIVPFNLLAGLCYLILPALADKIWSLVGGIIDGLHTLITELTSLPTLANAWLYTPVNTAILLMALLALLPWLLPRGLVSRWLVLPPLTLVMMTIYANQQRVSLVPTLYVLPTGDSYLSAAVLLYPIANHNSDNHLDHDSTNLNSTHWLFLADHRASDSRTTVSQLTADKLSVTLVEQLSTLSITHLDGIVVQTGIPALSDTLKQRSKKNKDSATMLLPLTVLRLNQIIPINQYWQAGRHERWSTMQTLEQQTRIPAKPLERSARISAQDCERGKSWQLANGDLKLQALTGWRDIEDSRVWDCTMAIESRLPIQVLRYNAAKLGQYKSLETQKLTKKASNIDKPAKDAQHNKSFASRLIVDAATHERSWQLWSLLCEAEPLALDINAYYSSRWLGHSTSQIAADAISRQGIEEVITYDAQALEAALGFKSAEF